MTTTFFSIVIPVHNRAHTLSNCIESILNQTYKNFELILVDDHSTDTSIKVIKQYAKNDSRIKLINQIDEKKGAQAARNTGIKVASYDWIMFNDSDDIWAKNKIQRELTVLEKHDFSEKVIIYSDCNTINVTSSEKKYWALPDISETESYKDLLLTSAPMFQSLLCSKDHLKNIDYLDEKVPSYQEWDTSIRLAKDGYFVHIKEALFDYYIGATDAISKSNTKDFIGRCNIYNKFKSEIIRVYDKKIFQKTITDHYINNVNKLNIEQLAKDENIIVLFIENLKIIYGKNYKTRIKTKQFVKKLLQKSKSFLLKPARYIHQSNI